MFRAKRGPHVEMVDRMVQKSRLTVAVEAISTCCSQLRLFAAIYLGLEARKYPRFA